MTCKNEHEHCPHADESAERAVKRVFAILGVDVDKPEQVEEFRKDLRFGASLRRASDKGMLVLVAAFFTGLAYAVWYGVIHMLTSKG